MDQQKRLKFLILEDDEQTHHYLELLISDYCPATFYHAHTIEEAQKIVKERNIHLMFVDHYLVGQDDGFSFISQLRKTNDTTPIAAISANGDPVEIQLAFDAGADEYLTKPFNETKIKRFIEKFLR